MGCWIVLPRFQNGHNQIIVVRKTSWMGAHLHKMPLPLRAPDPPDLSALFQIVPVQRIAAVGQHEVRWDSAQILPLLRPTPKSGPRPSRSLSIISRTTWAKLSTIPHGPTHNDSSTICGALLRLMAVPNCSQIERIVAQLWHSRVARSRSKLAR